MKVFHLANMMRFWLGTGLVCLLGCGGAIDQQNASRDSLAGKDAPVSDSSFVVNSVEGPVSDSLVTSDTLEALEVAPELWARITTTDYEEYDAELEVDIRSTAHLTVEGFRGHRKLFEANLPGSEGKYLGPCWLTAAAEDGSLWVLNCTENMFGVGAASPVATICLDGSGKEIHGLAPEFDPYVQTALLQLDGRRLLEGGRVLDLKSRKWTDLEGAPGKGFCSDTVDGHTLLVVGSPKGQRSLNAYFYSLPDLKMKLRFPCECAGPSGSSDGIWGRLSERKFIFDLDTKRYAVDLDTWNVDSSEVGALRN